jgi:hypothetical protein
MPLRSPFLDDRNDKSGSLDEGGNVSMNRGTSAESRAHRANGRTAAFRPCSKSTNVSADHSRCRNSSLGDELTGRSSRVLRT